MEVPRVTVILPVYNGERFLAQSLASVLQQEFDDFECIAINDGSRDGSAAMLNQYARRDDRIAILTHAKNQGIVAALNAGLARARGEYIARIDADDIAAPARLTRQVERLNRDPRLALIGSWAEVIDAEGRTVRRVRLPTRDETIRACMLLGNQFIHSTVMFRRRIIDAVGPYRNRFPHAEDYDLWLRILERFPAANIPAYLTRWRRTAGGVSQAHPRAQRDATATLRQRYLEKHMRQGPQGHRIVIQAFRINPYDPLLREALDERGTGKTRLVGSWRRRWYELMFRVRRQVKRILAAPPLVRLADRCYPH